MSLFANLYLRNNASGAYTNAYQVVQCEVKVSRHHNSYTPDGNPRCDQLILSVMLFEWYINQTLLSGKVIIDLANQSSKYDITTRTLKFEDAKCFSIAETYNISDTNRHMLKLGIMAKKLEIDEIEFQ